MSPRMAPATSHDGFTPSMLPEVQQFGDSMDGGSESVIKVMCAFVEKMDERMQRQRQELESRLTPAPTECCSSQQLDALQLRLGSLHRAKLLASEELETIEDLIADVLELKATTVTGGVLTSEIMCGGSVAAKLAKLIAVSEGMAADVSFSRQLRRKFLG